MCTPVGNSTGPWYCTTDQIPTMCRVKDGCLCNRGFYPPMDTPQCYGVLLGAMKNGKCDSASNLPPSFVRKSDKRLFREHSHSPVLALAGNMLSRTCTRTRTHAYLPTLATQLHTRMIAECTPIGNSTGPILCTEQGLSVGDKEHGFQCLPGAFLFVRACA